MQIVLLSGGLDSTVVLAKAQIEYSSDSIRAVHFQYPSKQWEREQLSAIEIANHYGIRLVSPTIQGLTVPKAMAKGGVQTVKQSIVFARNLVFITEAVKLLGEPGGIWFGGSLEDAKAGYADCQSQFIAPMQSALQWLDIDLHAPLMYLDKVSVVKFGMEMEAPLELTYSCYEGDMHPCGVCPACVTRINALKEAGYDSNS